MPTKSTFIAPKVWRRPLTTIYADNYKYGSSLYAGAINDIERKYLESMGRTQFRSDRADLNLSSLAEQPTSHSSNVVPSSTNPPSPSGGASTTEQRARAAAAAAAADVLTGSAGDPPLTRSMSASRAQELNAEAHRQIHDLSSFESYMNECKARRSRSRSRRVRDLGQTSSAMAEFESELYNGTSDLDHSRLFREERWYTNSLRGVSHDLYTAHLKRALLV